MESTLSAENKLSFLVDRSISKKLKASGVDFSSFVRLLMNILYDGIELLDSIKELLYHL